MAGRVRQPIDVKALEAYIMKTVPEIQCPIDVKQVGFKLELDDRKWMLTPHLSSVLDSQTRRTNSPPPMARNL